MTLLVIATILYAPLPRSMKPTMKYFQEIYYLRFKGQNAPKSNIYLFFEVNEFLPNIRTKVTHGK